jgi:hypothetical protein
MVAARTLLLIADIGGCTDYMRTHRMSLAHAKVAPTLQAATQMHPRVPLGAAVRRDRSVPVQRMQRMQRGEQPEAEIRRARR